MLSAVLRTPVAEEVSIRIMDAFVQMKRIISNNITDRSYIDNMVIRHDNEINIFVKNKLFQKCRDSYRIDNND